MNASLLSKKSFPDDSMQESLVDQYLSVRDHSLKICQHLENEDLVVQPCHEVSPPKWHLAHTTWFFEELILVEFLKNYSRFNEDDYRLLFNSYYKSAGNHWLQSNRGCLSRPTVKEIYDYRNHVDEKMTKLLNSSSDNKKLSQLIEIGLHHEQQHQELLLMDIKYILGVNPSFPSYTDQNYLVEKSFPNRWIDFKEGIYEIGHGIDSFCFDNEKPKHKTYLQNFSISQNTISNQEYLNFINDQAYQNPKLWLSLGWDWINQNQINAPLYWKKIDDQWFEFTLYGLKPLVLSAPVTHISYFEAQAFAHWAEKRLPTEAELEIFLQDFNQSYDLEIFHPNDLSHPINQVWCWSSSHYSAYPGFQPFEGMLGEYNGKFMCNQFVLKGGCVATPINHYRPTYRNFYGPHQRWMFSGIRLAKDL